MSSGKICGENIPNTIISHGPVYVEFTSDYSVTKWGFVLNYGLGKNNII